MPSLPFSSCRDRPSVPFSTCCGAVPVQYALGTVIMIIFTFEVIETIQYLFNPNFEVSSIWEFMFEVIEAVIFMCLVLAWLRRSQILLIPFIIQSLVTLCLGLIVNTLLFWSFIFPFSSAAESLVPPLLPSEHRRVYFIYLFVFFTIFNALFVWFVIVAFTAYQWFDDLHKKEIEFSSRRLPTLEDPTEALSSPSSSGPKPMALVINDSTQQIPVTGNFSNPNYSDDEEELFTGNERKGKVGMV